MQKQLDRCCSSKERLARRPNDPLAQAVVDDNTDEVTRLLERSHPVGGQARARKKGDMAPLAYAVDTGRATCVEQLLAAGATLKDGVQLEPKFEDFTLLHRTSTLPDQTVAITIAGQLIDKGASVDATTKMVNGFRLCPLSLAWLTGKPSLCEFLLNAKSGNWWEEKVQLIHRLMGEPVVLSRLQSSPGMQESVMKLRYHQTIANVEKEMLKKVKDGTTDEKALKRMLDLGASPDLLRILEDGKGALIVSAIQSPKPNPDIVRVLIECRAALDTPKLPLILMETLASQMDPECELGRRDLLLSCADHLVKAGVHAPRDYVHEHITHGFRLDSLLMDAENDMVARVLLDAGADPNGSYLNDDVAALKTPPSAYGSQMAGMIPAHLFIFEDGCRPLWEACRKGQVSRVKLLLEAKATVNTPPVCSVLAGWTKLEDVHALAWPPTTPLTASLLRGSAECAKLVLEAGGGQLDETGLGAVMVALPLLLQRRSLRVADRAGPEVTSELDECVDVVRKIAAEHNDPLLRQELARLFDASSDGHVIISPPRGGRAEDLAPSARQQIEQRRLLGRRVRVDGLHGKPKLNGKVGLVTGFDATSERSTVLLDDGERFNLRPSKLALEGADDIRLSWAQTDSELYLSIFDTRQTPATMICHQPEQTMICLRSTQLSIRVEVDDGAAYLVTQQLHDQVLRGSCQTVAYVSSQAKSVVICLTKRTPGMWPSIGPAEEVERVMVQKGGAQPEQDQEQIADHQHQHRQDGTNQQPVKPEQEFEATAAQALCLKLIRAFCDLLSKGGDEDDAELIEIIEALKDFESADQQLVNFARSTFLSAAIGQDRRNLAEKLVASGASAKSFSCGDPASDAGPKLSPLAFACQNGAIRCAELLLDHQADVNVDLGSRSGSPLSFAINRRDPTLLQLLIERGAAPESKETALFWAVDDVIDAASLYGNKQRKTGMQSDGAWQCFEYLLRAGVATQETAAAPEGVVKQFRQVLDAARRCMDSPSPSSDQMQPVLEGLDALSLPLGTHGPMAQGGECVVQKFAKPLVMDALLSAGKVTRKEPLDAKVISLLLQHGALPNGYSGRGHTVLHNAVASKSPESVKMLLDAQADPSFFCQIGKGKVTGSPLSYACIMGEPQLVQLLLEAGARTDVVRIVDGSEMSAKELLEHQSLGEGHGRKNKWQTCLQKLDYFEKKKAKAAKAASDKEETAQKQRARHEAFEATHRAELEAENDTARRALKKATDADELEGLERAIEQHGQHVRAGSSTLKRAIAKLNLLMSTEAHTQLKAALEANTLPELRAAISKYGPAIDGSTAEKGKDKGQANALVSAKASFVATPDLKQRLMYARKERDRLAEEQREAVKKANLEEKAAKVRERQEADRKEDAEAREIAAALARAKAAKELEQAHAERVARGEAAANDHEYEEALRRSLDPSGGGEEPAGEACSPPFAAAGQQAASPLTPSVGAFGNAPAESENGNDDDDSWTTQSTRKKERGDKPRTDPVLDWDDPDGTNPSPQPKSQSTSAKTKHASSKGNLTLGGILAAHGLSDRLEAFKYYIECSGTPLHNIMSVIQLRNIEAKLRSSPAERHELLATVDAWYSGMAEQKRKEEAIFNEIVYSIDVAEATGLQKVEIERDGNCAYACAARWYEEYGAPRLTPKETEEMHALGAQIKVFRAVYEEQHGKKPKKLTEYAPVREQVRRYKALQSREKEADAVELQMAGSPLDEGVEGSEQVHDGGAVESMRRLVSQKLSDKLRHHDAEVCEAVDQEVRQMCASSAATGTDGPRGSNPTATAFLEMLDSGDSHSGLPSASSSLLEASSADSCDTLAVVAARDHFVAVHTRRSIFAERLQLKLMADVLKTDVHLYYYLAGGEGNDTQAAGAPREIFRPGVYADGEPAEPVDADDAGPGIRPPLRLLHLMASKHFDLLLERPQADAQPDASSPQPLDGDACSLESSSNTPLTGSPDEEKVAPTTSLPGSIAATPHNGSGQDRESSCTGSDTINEYSGHSSLSGAWDSPPEQQRAGAAGDVKDLSPTLPRALLPQFASEGVEREPDSYC